MAGLNHLQPDNMLLFKDEAEESAYYFEHAQALLNVRRKAKHHVPLTAEDESIQEKVLDELYRNKKLYGYTFTFLKEKFPTFMANVDHSSSIFVDAYMELFENFHRYNGKFALTTFARLHLLHGAQKYVAFQQNKNAYQNEKYNLIRRARMELMQEGYEESEITNTLLASRTKLSASQVASVLAANVAADQEEFNPDASYTVGYKTPEDEVIANAKVELCHDILKVLTATERYVLYRITGERASVKSVAEDAEFIRIAREEGYGGFIVDGVFRQDKLRTICDVALAKCKQTPQAQRNLAERSNSLGQIASIYNIADKLENEGEEYFTAVFRDTEASFDETSQYGDLMIEGDNRNEEEKSIPKRRKILSFTRDDDIFKKEPKENKDNKDTFDEVPLSRISNAR